MTEPALPDIPESNPRPEKQGIGSASITTVLRIRTYLSETKKMSIDEVAELLRTPKPIIERLVSEEIVLPAVRENEAQPYFTCAQVREIESSLRLHEELGVNWAGIAIIRDLLDRLDRVHKQMHTTSLDRVEAKDTSWD